MKSIIEDLMKGTDYEQRELREKRKNLLLAFDKYKTNVQYGIEEESVIEHNEIMEWYHDLLDLKSEAFNNVPARIQYYL